MRPALYAEWTKLRTVSGPAWLLVGTVAMTVTLSAAVTAVVRCPTNGCAVDTAKLSLTGIDLGQTPVAVLAVLTISNEYGTGLIRATLTATPHRMIVLVAKAITLTVAVIAAGVVAVLASLLVGWLLLPGNGFTPARGYPPLSLTDGPVLRAASGSVLYLALVGLFSLGIATVVRDSATAIGTVLGLLYLFPVTAMVAGPQWQRLLQQVGPMSAGLAIQATRDLRGLPIGPWPGLGVLAAWASAALLLGGLLLGRRDA